MQEMQVQSLSQKDPLEKGIATHPSIACRIPRTEEPGGSQSMESQSQTRLKQLSTHASTYIKKLPRWHSGQESTRTVGDPGLIPGLGRSPAEGNGYPLQYSCLEDSTDQGTCRLQSVEVSKESDTTEQLTLALISYTTYMNNIYIYIFMNNICNSLLLPQISDLLAIPQLSLASVLTSEVLMVACPFRNFSPQKLMQAIIPHSHHFFHIQGYI